MKHIMSISESFNERRKREIEEEIGRKRKEIEDLEMGEAPVIDLDSYTDEDKIKFFNSMYKMALDHLETTERERYADEDIDNWFFEEGFSILNLKDRKKLWGYYKKLT